MRSKRLVAFCSPSPRSVRGPDEPDELAGFDQQRDDGLMVGAADIFSVQRDGTDWRRVHKAALGHLLHYATRTFFGEGRSLKRSIILASFCLI